MTLLEAKQLMDLRSDRRFQDLLRRTSLRP